MTGELRTQEDTKSAYEESKLYMIEPTGKSQLSQLLMDASLFCEHRSELLLRQVERHVETGRFALQFHKAALRLIHASNKLRAESEEENHTQQHYTYKAFCADIFSYGLIDSDVEKIDEWRKTDALKNRGIEPQFGTFRKDEYTPRIFKKHLKEENDHGTYVELDLAGLKVYNTVSNAFGDTALLAVADFGRYVYEKLEIPNGEIGRRGDEFYLFFPNVDPETVAMAIARAYHDFYDEGGFLIQFEDENNKEIHKKEVQFYWRVSQVKRSTFNSMIQKMENEIEDEKITYIKHMLQRLAAEERNGADAYVTLLKYLEHKRVPSQVVEKIVDAGVEFVLSLLALAPEEEGVVRRGLVDLQRMFSSPDSEKLLSEILAETANGNMENWKRHIIHS